MPGSIVALVVGTRRSSSFNLPVDTIGAGLAAFPSGLPSIDIPDFRADLIIPLLPAALTVALLAAVESLLSAVVADTMTGDRHNSNAELMAQGVANCHRPIVGGIPVTGAIARTATNFRSGARTPVAGHRPRAHAARCGARRWRRWPPTSRWRRWRPCCSSSPTTWANGARSAASCGWSWADKSVWLITFALTVIADLTMAVEVGMALAALLYIYRVTDTTSVER